MNRPGEDESAAMLAPRSRRLAILGGGGHASEVLAILEVPSPEGRPLDILIGDDHWTRPDRFAARRAQLLSIDAALATADEFIAGVGYPDPKIALTSRAAEAGIEPAGALVHPRSEIGTGVELGRGVVVHGLAWISPLVRVGDHAYVGYGTKVGHDSTIGAFSSLMPGCFVAGDAVIGDGALVGAGATVLQGIRVGAGAVVGAGATVINDVGDGEVVAGTPARSISARTRAARRSPSRDVERERE